MTARKIVTDLKGLKFDTDTSFPGSYSSHAAIRARNIKFAPTINMHAPGYQKPENARGPDDMIVGGKGGTLTFETILRAEQGVGAGAEFQSLAAMGGGTATVRPSGSGKVASATGTTLVGLTADIGAYTVGDAICVTGSGTDTQIRFITRVQDATPTAPDTTLTISPAWSDTPSASDDVVGCDTFTPAIEEPTNYGEFLCYVGHGTGSDKLLYTITDCACTGWKLVTTTADALPVIEWTFECDSWADSEASASLGADSFAAGHPLLGDKFFVDGTTTVIESIGFDPGMQVVPFPATSGTNGRAGFNCVGFDPRIEIKPYSDVDWYTKFEAGTTFEVMFESVKDANEAWAIWCPSCQIVSVAPDAMSNGLYGQNPEIVLTDPGVNADSTNYPLFAIATLGAT